MPAEPTTLALLASLVLAAAVLYSAGGHGGASAYLALMALFGVSPAASKPTALLMNAAVTLLGTARFSRARAVPWRTVRWLAAGSVPASFAAGHLRLATHVHQLVLGGALLVAAALLVFSPIGRDKRDPPHAATLSVLGALLGGLAGATGIGGGVFLTPLLLLTGWEAPRRAAGAAAVFILLNSLAALVGHLHAGAPIPPAAGMLVPIAFAGALLGTWLGARRLAPATQRAVHAVVLVVSGAKLVLDGVLA